MDQGRRQEEQERNTAAHQLSRADPQYRTAEQQVANAQRQQVCANTHPSFRGLNYQPYCCKGNVQLESFPQPQPFLQHLYEGTQSDSNHFLNNIRKYNSVFQMTSFGCNEVTMPGFNPSFRIQGQVYHCIGSMVPSADESPQNFV